MPSLPPLFLPPYLRPSLRPSLPLSLCVSAQAVILVTGGSGLVGKAIEHVVNTSEDPRFRKQDGETWVFLTSKDGDLRCVEARVEKNVGRSGSGRGAPLCGCGWSTITTHVGARGCSALKMMKHADGRNHAVLLRTRSLVTPFVPLSLVLIR